MGRHAHSFSRPSDTRPHPAGPTTTRRTRPRREPVPSGVAAVPAPRRPVASTTDAVRPGPRAAEAMLTPQALLGWGAFASTVAALTVVVLHGTVAHALAVAALGLSATVLLGWLAGPPDAPAARAVARVRHTAAQLAADLAADVAVIGDRGDEVPEDDELEVVDLRGLDPAEDGEVGGEDDADELLDLTRTDAGRADR